MIEKTTRAITWLLELPSRRRLERTINYFERKHRARRDVLLSHNDVRKPLPNEISSFEVVGCLVLYLGAEPMPVDTLLERHTPHSSWTQRFDETLLLAIEETARDFRTMGWDSLSQRLLKYGQFAATQAGRNEWVQRFHERLVRGIRGFYGQRR